MQRYFLVSCLLILLTGCADTLPGDVWKDTKRAYDSYLNPPVTVDLSDLGPCSDYEMCLGGAMSRVDQQLQLLQRVMDNSDQSLDQKWVQGMIRRFPWLSGIAIIDANGSILARYPEYSMKEFDASGLLVEDPKQSALSLRAVVVDSPLGAEVYVGKPIYAEGILRAIVIAHFDMRALVSISEDPGAFMIATPGFILWPGVYDPVSTPVYDAKWDELIKSSNKGSISNSTGTFYWMSVYFANLPIVYTLPSKGEFTKHPEQLEVLEQVEVLAAPNFRKDMQSGSVKERVNEADVRPMPEHLPTEKLSE